ncbi:MAG: glycosyltransferase [Candidatus Omnitrophota bacterium]
MENRRRHIVMLNKAYPPWTGGIERHVRDISEELARRGWRVSVLCGANAPFETREWNHSVRVIRVPRWGSLLSQPLLTRFFLRLEELKPDMLHIHVPFPLGWFAANQVFQRIPIVAAWHSDIVRQRFFKPFFHPFEQLFLSRCDRIIPTSEPLLQSSRALRKHRDKCVAIPLAVRENGMKSSPRSVHKIREQYGSPIVLFVGRLVGYKGLPYLLRAMANVNAVLLIAGDGPLRDKLEGAAKKIASPGKIHFLGHVPDEKLGALHRTADIFVLPSIARSEAFGYALLDAMREGCPAISTNLPTGVSFVNQDGETGLVVPPRNSSALADAINRLLSDEPLRRRLGEGAKARVEQHFMLDSAIDRLEKIYFELMP